MKEPQAESVVYVTSSSHFKSLHGVMAVAVASLEHFLLPLSPLKPRQVYRVPL